MKNLLTQWGTKEEDQKINEYVIGKKSPNPVGQLRRKTGRSLKFD